MLPLQILSKLIKILRSNQAPSQIAGGFILGLFLGMIPQFNLIHVLVILVVVLVNVNITAVVFSLAVFKMVAYLLDPVLHALGYSLLVDAGFLQGLWRGLYNAPVIPYTRFYNTVVMGSAVTAMLLAVPLYVAVSRFVIVYREKLEAKIKANKWVKFVKGTALFKWYERIRQIAD